MGDEGQSQLQNLLQQEVDKFKVVQKEYHKALQQRQTLDGQLNENTAVKQELDLMKGGAEVYKLIGPVLIKQDLEEAKQNVAKRMDYIRNELKRMDEMIVQLDKKQETHRETLNKLQQQFQQMQVKV
ncbi:prefoldin subunit 6 [Anabrus simplex]|uniref:prefoldin subunit 6 n=1 Tax=Anabrus simplex TaxID=316456 RepID=UPI0034DCCA64